jgi:hypothetical protein
VLCGVGGRTIAEAQQRLSYREFLSWALYRSKRGSFNVGMRVEHGSGLLAAIYANTKSKEGGYRVHDFAPHHDDPPVTLEQAMENWK